MPKQTFFNLTEEKRRQIIDIAIDEFADNDYAKASISAWPVNYTQTDVGNERWGWNVKRVITPHGDIDVIFDPALTAKMGMADVLVLIDPAHVRQVYLPGLGRWQVIKKVASLSDEFNIIDGVKHQAGLQLSEEELHTWLEGIS